MYGIRWEVDNLGLSFCDRRRCLIIMLFYIAETNNKKKSYEILEEEELLSGLRPSAELPIEIGGRKAKTKGWADRVDIAFQVCGRE